MQSNFLNLLTICRKAGKLTAGFDASNDAALKCKAECILVSSDVSAKTKKEISFTAAKNNIPVILVPLNMSDLTAVFRKKTAVMAVCDKGFARRFAEMSAEE